MYTLLFVLVTIEVAGYVGGGVEWEGGVGELLEREGGGRVDTRKVRGDVLTPTAAQQKDKKHLEIFIIKQRKHH